MLIRLAQIDRNIKVVAHFEVETYIYAWKKIATVCVSSAEKKTTIRLKNSAFQFQFFIFVLV